MLHITPRKGPWLTVVSGPMFSGKSEYLIEIYRELTQVHGYRSEHIGVYKHSLDGRYSRAAIVSHAGRQLPAVPVESAEELLSFVNSRNERVVLLDEGQFFLNIDPDGHFVLVRGISQLLTREIWIVIAGLDKDFRGLPFGPMADLLALADERTSLFGRCAVCGAPASLTQRLVNGKPAHVDDPLLLVGAQEVYEPRCRQCHRLEGGSEGLGFSPFAFMKEGE